MDVWVEYSNKFHKCSLAPVSFIHILEFLLLRLEDEDIQLFVVVARQLWLRINSYVFGGDLVTPLCVVHLAKDQLHNFLDSEQTHNNSAIHSLSLTICICWLPPPTDVIKCNWDVTISKKEQRMGMGFLARNSIGHVLTSYCATKLDIVDPSIAQAILAWKIIEVVVSFGFQVLYLKVTI
jgi:hypothetical protein